MQEELGLNTYAMDARMYDPAIARWVVQDPVVHHDYSPYSAFNNNPIFYADPSGADSSSILDTEENNRVIYRGGHWSDAIRGASGHFKNSNQSVNNIKRDGKLITDQLSYREKGAKKGDFLNFEYSLLDRFKNSKLDPEAEVGYDRDKEILKVIESIDGLKEFYLAMGSPKITNYGRSSKGYRGFTFPNNTVAIYDSAYSNYFWLVSTIFHELTHIYQYRGLPLGVG